MKMHILSGGRLRMRSSMYFADVPKDETREFPCVSVLLRHRGGNVLFDTGCHPDVPRDPQARWGGIAKAIAPIHRPGEDVLGGLAGLGLGANDIDVVVNSHLHMDHCGCNAFFRKATFYQHALERRAAADPSNEGKGYFKIDWDHDMPVEGIDRETDIFSDNRIVLLPLPGHTPGSIGAMVELDRSGAHLLAGDALSVRASLTSSHLPRNNWNSDVFQTSLALIRRLEERGTHVICGHDDAQWATLRKGADAYD
jgi:glyoxylase-like metal-dependent hydrolase (beta-lactamase superfamily II)